ncbi:ATP-binding protein [Marinicellulosiphila megalodicopiae]|uniref:ATP-binding protein n=1 Tax=Marinicellulosiphila megalodicopiae TaxID=2724896 RepID=UPI003BB0A57A
MPIQKKITIGLQVVSLSDSYNNTIIDCINTLAVKLNVNLILFLGGAPGNPNLDQEHHQSVIYEQINSKNVDAVILLTPTLSNYLTEQEFKQLLIKFSSVPVVSIGMDISNFISRQSSIIVDSIFGFSELIKDLIVKQKYKNIAFVSGPLRNPEALMRLNIYKELLTKYKIEIKEENIYYGYFIREDGPAALDKFLSNENIPDVIICSNDVCAISMIEELTLRKIKVPQQIAVTGFDNINESKLCTPTLTTVSQPFVRMGALAFELAMKHINKQSCEKLYTLDSTFVTRNSSGFHSVKKTKNQLEYDLNKYVLPFIEKNIDNEVIEYDENIYELLSDIVFKLMQQSNNNIDRSIVEFEEHYYPILEERLKSDIRLKSGYKIWLGSIEKLEKSEVNSSKKSKIINLITILIRESMEKEFALTRSTDISSRDNIYFVKDIIDEISDSKTFDELADGIRSKYLQLSRFIDLQNYLVLGYPNPVKKIKNMKWIPPNKIDTILSFNDIKNDNFKNSKNHDATLLFPKKLKPNKSRCTMVVETIYNSDDQLGRVIYELYPREIDLFACAMITSQITSTIRNIHQNKARLIAQEKIQTLVSDLESKNKLAEEAVTAKGHFLATMSHEIRTPMNGVLGVTELLQNTKLTEKQNNYLQIIQNSAHSLLNIISDILDFSKIEEGKLSVEHIEFELMKLCNEVISVFSFDAQKKNIKLNLSIHEDVPTIIVSDPTRLRQILINLIGNAFKFTEKGSITLGIELESNTDFNKENPLLKFSIIDTGIGISIENIEKLFGAFNQADSSITRKFGGSGLGLSISKSLSELMGGDIGVTSKVNSGSIFWFTILSNQSKAKPKPAVQTNVRDTIPRKSLKGKKILVAEDNKVNQIVIKGMVKKLGAQAVVVDNGQEAFKAYQEGIDEYDLIIMDFEMPVLDGASSARKIRALENLINTDDTTSIRIPIVAITAHAMNEHRESCIEAGMDDFLSKPIDSELLFEMLDKYL